MYWLSANIAKCYGQSLSLVEVKVSTHKPSLCYINSQQASPDVSTSMRTSIKGLSRLIFLLSNKQQTKVYLVDYVNYLLSVQFKIKTGYVSSHSGVVSPKPYY